MPSVTTVATKKGNPNLSKLQTRHYDCKEKNMKKSRKLVLHRETLHALELRGVAGAVLTPTLGLYCQGGIKTQLCNGDTYGYCPNTMENCSAPGFCETGGAACTGASCP
jgi:hypothetical protein